MREAIIEYQPRMRELPSEEKPRERLRAHGVDRLSTADLLAILLGTGTRSEDVVVLATRLLREARGLEALGRFSYSDLCRLPGVGAAKAAQVLAGIELGRRIVSATPEERRVIRCSDDIDRFCRADMVDLPQEEVRVLLLDTRNRMLRMHTAYQGNAHSAIVRVGELFREAVRDNATNVAIVHNHPSGDPAPSPSDVSLTAQVIEAGRMLGIEVLDHVVIARGGYVSLREKGLWAKEAAQTGTKAAATEG